MVAKAIAQGTGDPEHDQLRPQLNEEVSVDNACRFKKTDFREALMANKLFVMAIDNSLQKGAGLALSDFKPEAPVRPLKPTEFRTRVELPAAGQVTGSSTYRSIVCDRISKETRVELPRRRLPDGSLAPFRILHKTQDEGAVGLPASFFLDRIARATTTEDPWHRCCNDIKEAMVASGVWLVVLEHSVVYNTPTGPWSSGSFGAQIRGATVDFFEVNSFMCEPFRIFYSRIASDLDVGIVGLGTHAHMEETWTKARNLSTMIAKGDRVKLGRWQSFFNVARHWKPYSLCIPWCSVGLASARVGGSRPPNFLWYIGGRPRRMRMPAIR